MFNNAVLQFQMSGNSRDRQIAYSAAEAALRDAEKYIRHSGRICGLSEQDADDIDDSRSCNNGFCYNGANMNDDGTSWLTTTPVWSESAGYWQPTAASCQSSHKVIWYSDESCGGDREFLARDINNNVTNPDDVISNCSWAMETYTEPSEIPLVNQQPQYLIEGFQKTAEGETTYYYRITARGWGTRSGTQVTLQSVFSPMY